MVQKLFWQENWQKSNTPWDLGGQHPILDDIFSFLRGIDLLRAGDAVYVPGCGSAHDAAFWARAGLRVVAEDFVSEAIGVARQKYGQLANLELAVADVFAPSERAMKFACVYDRAMFCALYPDQRKKYIRTVSEKLGQGGIFISIPFMETCLPLGVEAAGPPFAISVEEFFALVKDDYTLVKAECLPSSAIAVVKQEMLFIWRKRGERS